jgi:glycosyltransferase involved in cell wall biosynthesis
MHSGHAPMTPRESKIAKRKAVKIAILTNAYPPDGKGGAERIAWLQAEGLASRGHEVRVWAPWSGVKDQGSGVRVMRFASSFLKMTGINAFSRLFFHLRDLFPRKGLVKEISVWHPDVLITHNLTGCGIGTPKEISKFKILNSKFFWVHVLHDVQLAEPSGQIEQYGNTAIQQFLQKIWRAFWSLLRRSVFGTPGTLVSPSSWLLDWHRGYGFHGKSEVVLPNPVEIGERRERELKHPATIAYVGRLSADKGFADILKMIPKLDPADVGSIVVVGDGPMRADARNFGDRRAVLRGVLPSAEARQAIADADLLIVPSRIHENQPTVILEAMAEGTPVIATDVGGVRELLDGTDSSVLAVADDLGERLAKEVADILGDSERWNKISTALRARAEERHEAGRYLDSLEGLLAKGEG